MSKSLVKLSLLLSPVTLLPPRLLAQVIAEDSDSEDDAGLFQIVGPLANPSASDLASLDGTPRADIEALPSRRLARSGISSDMLAGEFASRRLSLEAQLQPIESSLAKKWSASQRAM